MNERISVNVMFIDINVGIIALMALIYFKGEMYFGAIRNFLIDY